MKANVAYGKIGPVLDAEELKLFFTKWRLQSCNGIPDQFLRTCLN